MTAFTRIGLLVVLVMLFLFAGIMLPTFVTSKQKAKRITCVCHLKQIGLAYRTFADDHVRLVSVQASINHSGSNESDGTGEVFRYFQAMSNDLASPLILRCPGDWRRVPSGSFASLANTNLSYFVNLTALESAETMRSHPQMFLSGDRHLRSNRRITDNVLVVRTNDLVYWTRANHQGAGNVALADGSVQQFRTPALQKAFTSGSPPTTRLAIP